MNCLQNWRSVLSRLRHRKPAVCTPPPPRWYYTFGILRDRPALRPPPPTQAPARRYPHTAPRRNEIIRFTPHPGGSRWYHDHRKVTSVVLVSGGAAIAACFGNLETVPYTDRTHLIILSPKYERQLGESQFAALKVELASKILPPLHPDSVRVRHIASEIVRAVHRGLASRQCHGSSDGADATHGYGDISADLTVKNRDAEAFAVMLKGSPPKNASAAQRDDEAPVERGITGGKARGAQPERVNLDGWEVIVVRDDMVIAMCLPGGKIVVFTGLLKKFKTDAEIATVIGHEVGHAIARHCAEQITKNMWFTILRIVILQFIDMPDEIRTISELFVRLPFSRRMEMEADLIGLMLLAAAGYDPRVAPGVYKKLGKLTGDSVLNDYLSTHPSSKKRSHLLSQAHIMNKALELYREVSTRQ